MRSLTGGRADVAGLRVSESEGVGVCVFEGASILSNVGIQSV